MEINSVRKIGAEDFDAMEIILFFRFQNSFKSVKICAKTNGETIFSVFFNALLFLKQTNKQKFRMVKWNKTIIKSGL